MALRAIIAQGLAARIGYVSPTSQRNPYSGFDNAAAYTLPASMAVSGSQLVFTAAPTFATSVQAYGFRTPVTPSIPYTISISAVSITSGPKTLRIIAEYWKGQQFADGQSTITAQQAGTDQAVSTGGTISGTFTPPSDCTHIQLVFECRDASAVTGTFDNFTVTG